MILTILISLQFRFLYIKTIHLILYIFLFLKLIINFVFKQNLLLIFLLIDYLNFTYTYNRIYIKFVVFKFVVKPFKFLTTNLKLTTLIWYNIKNYLFIIYNNILNISLKKKRYNNYIINLIMYYNQFFILAKTITLLIIGLLIWVILYLITICTLTFLLFNIEGSEFFLTSLFWFFKNLKVILLIFKNIILNISFFYDQFLLFIPEWYLNLPGYNFTRHNVILPLVEFYSFYYGVLRNNFLIFTHLYSYVLLNFSLRAYYYSISTNPELFLVFLDFLSGGVPQTAKLWGFYLNTTLAGGVLAQQLLFVDCFGWILKLTNPGVLVAISFDAGTYVSGVLQYYNDWARWFVLVLEVLARYVAGALLHLLALSIFSWITLYEYSLYTCTGLSLLLTAVNSIILNVEYLGFCALCVFQLHSYWIANLFELCTVTLFLVLKFFMSSCFQVCYWPVSSVVTLLWALGGLLAQWGCMALTSIFKFVLTCFGGLYGLTWFGFTLLFVFFSWMQFLVFGLLLNLGSTFFSIYIALFSSDFFFFHYFLDTPFWVGVVTYAAIIAVFSALIFMSLTLERTYTQFFSKNTSLGTLIDPLGLGVQNKSGQSVLFWTIDLFVGVFSQRLQVGGIVNRPITLLPRQIPNHTVRWRSVFSFFRFVLSSFMARYLSESAWLVPAAPSYINYDRFTFRRLYWVFIEWALLHCWGYLRELALGLKHSDAGRINAVSRGGSGLGLASPIIFLSLMPWLALTSCFESLFWLNPTLIWRRQLEKLSGNQADSIYAVSYNSSQMLGHDIHLVFSSSHVEALELVNRYAGRHDSRLSSDLIRLGRRGFWDVSDRNFLFNTTYSAQIAVGRFWSWAYLQLTEFDRYLETQNALEDDPQEIFKTDYWISYSAEEYGHIRSLAGVLRGVFLPVLHNFTLFFLTLLYLGDGELQKRALQPFALYQEHRALYDSEIRFSLRDSYVNHKILQLRSFFDYFIKWNAFGPVFLSYAKNYSRFTPNFFKVFEQQESLPLVYSEFSLRPTTLVRGFSQSDPVPLLVPNSFRRWDLPNTLFRAMGTSSYLGMSGVPQSSRFGASELQSTNAQLILLTRRLNVFWSKAVFALDFTDKPNYSSWSATDSLFDIFYSQFYYKYISLKQAYTFSMDEYTRFQFLKKLRWTKRDSALFSNVRSGFFKKRFHPDRADSSNILVFAFLNNLAQSFTGQLIKLYEHRRDVEVAATNMVLVFGDLVDLTGFDLVDFACLPYVRSVLWFSEYFIRLLFFYTTKFFYFFYGFLLPPIHYPSLKDFIVWQESHYFNSTLSAFVEGKHFTFGVIGFSTSKHFAFTALGKIDFSS